MEWRSLGWGDSWEPFLETEPSRRGRGMRREAATRGRPVMSWSQKGREGQVSEVWEHNEGTKGILKGWGH